MPDQNLYRYAAHLPERTVGDKLREFVSVKDFGAKGDGVTNDTGAIQAAIDYAVQNGRREVFFSDGTYHLSSHSGVDASSSKMKEEVDKLKSENEIKSDKTARDLQMHLTALDHFERQQESDKIVKHTEGLLVLLDHQKEQEQLTDKAYTTLKSQSQALRQKWEMSNVVNSEGPVNLPHLLVAQVEVGASYHRSLFCINVEVDLPQLLMSYGCQNSYLQHRDDITSTK